MKPRINREYSILCKQNMWFCRGGGKLAIGDTWREALRIWRMSFEWVPSTKRWMRKVERVHGIGE